MEAFPPNIQNKKDIFRNQITGSQRLEYVIIPRKTGNFKIPSLEMSYYNLRLNSWSEIKTETMELKVSGEQPKFTTRSGLTKKEIELIGEDIRYIKSKSVTVALFLLSKCQLQRNFYMHYQFYFSFPFYTLLFFKK